jgi:Transglutaminase-like superfamily
MAPTWMVQSELYTRKAHFLWKPLGNELMKIDRPAGGPGGAPGGDASQRGGRGGGGGGGGDDSGGPKIPPSVLTWTPILPKDVEVKQTNAPGGMMGINAGARTLELTIRDVPALAKEEYMPPYEGLAYRVHFYYSAYDEQDEFWRTEGAKWSKGEDALMGPSPDLTAAVQSIVGASDPQEVRLKKIYVAVMALENTDFEPDHGAVGGRMMAKSAADTWKNKKGDSNQITELFVALARAAQLKAYVMTVPDRGEHIFMPRYRSLNQLTDKIAIVSLGGKEQFFDPGERYCAYGHLAWQHTLDQGLRQTDDGGTSITQETPGEAYKDSKTQRAADLTMDKDGSVSGPLTVIFSGNAALAWRQRSLRTDDAGIRNNLKDAVQRMLPVGLDVQLVTIEKLTDYESPLTVRLTMKGNLGHATGKSIVLPADPFESTAIATFPREKREQPVYFHYGSSLVSVMRVKFPAGVTVESIPAADKGQYLTSAVYSITSESTPSSVTIRHTFDITDVIFPVKEYSDLRAFYSKMEQKSHETVVLKMPAGAAGN